MTQHENSTTVAAKYSMTMPLIKSSLCIVLTTAVFHLHGVSGSDISTHHVDWSKVSANERNDERITYEAINSPTAKPTISNVPTIDSTVVTEPPTTTTPTVTPLPTTNKPPTPTYPRLKYVGDDGYPKSAYPLSECEGDCDYDSDCDGDLKCFQRHGTTESVPGCLGGETESKGTDYCYQKDAPIVTAAPTTAAPTISSAPTPTYPSLKYVGDEGYPKSAYPLSECEGDCDYDSDCDGDLKCFQRHGTTESVPGCLGGETESKGTDYCYQKDAPIVTAAPTTAAPTISSAPTPTYPSLKYVGDEGYPKSAYPLSECEGDCDYDSDCDGELKCFQRHGTTESVPGCLGGETESKGTDYCYQKDAPIVTAAPTTAAPTISSAPTPTYPSLKYVGDEGYPKSAYPLSECEGDCDYDSDCDGELKCFQRHGTTESVPGCLGGETESKGTDYCYQKDAPIVTYAPTITTSPSISPAPTSKSGGYKIYTKQGNLAGYNQDGWDNDSSWKDVIADVRKDCKALFYDDLDLVAKAIRLSFHDCMGKSEGYGCDGCVNLNNLDNTGLKEIMQKLYPIVKKYEDDISRTDTWVACASVALEMSTGRSYPMTYIGRQTCKDSDEIGDGGENYDICGGDDLDTSKLLHHFNKYFGFDEACTVAVMGLHGIGKMRPKNSGQGNGPGSATWVKNASYKLTNEYFNGFDDKEWTYEERGDKSWNYYYRKFGKKPQWYNGAYDKKRLVLLNADIALKWDVENYIDEKGHVYCKVSDEAKHHDGENPRKFPSCPIADQTYNIVKEYAADNEMFLDDLEDCMLQMFTTGYRDGFDGNYLNYYGEDDPAEY